ncbi:MAG: hypothetical protein NTX57_19840 [Armatimonadetes bacterium]|nr:hypothetical protein [Armatimonadota bacterium]
MSQVIVISQDETHDSYEARLNGTHGEGATLGAALDQLLNQLDDPYTPLLLVRQDRPDHFFSQKNFERLQELQRKAKSSLESLNPTETTELRDLIAKEFRATIQRSEALVAQAA